LVKPRLKRVYGVSVPDYKESLRKCLDEGLMFKLFRYNFIKNAFAILKIIERQNKKNIIKNEKILITGGAGFIGSHVYDFCKISAIQIFNLDALTYAGNLKYY
jgi:hypothetical protein